MGASSKFFKSLISGKRGGAGGGGVVVVTPAPSGKALSDSKSLSTAGSEKAVSETAPSERSHQSESKDDTVVVSLRSPLAGEFLAFHHGIHYIQSRPCIRFPPLVGRNS